MINKKIIINLLLLNFLLILSLNGVLSYTLKFPLCNSSSTINDSCINYITATAITNAPQAIMFLGQDGNIYLTNDTQIAYTIVNNITNITNNITNNYYYNATNGSDIIVVHNITANETYLKSWINSLNITSIFNFSGYNKSEIDVLLASKIDTTSLQTALANYATQTQLNNLNIVLNPNGTPINFTALQEYYENKDGDFSMTWKIIIIINCFLIVILILLIAKTIMTG